MQGLQVLFVFSPVFVDRREIHAKDELWVYCTDIARDRNLIHI